MTKQERHDTYKAMLLAAESKDTALTKFGFCNMLKYMKQNGEWSEVRLKAALPELYSFKPRKLIADKYWFDTDKAGWEKRIEVLKECIERTTRS